MGFKKNVRKRIKKNRAELDNYFYNKIAELEELANKLSKKLEDRILKGDESK